MRCIEPSTHIHKHSNFLLRWFLTCLYAKLKDFLLYNRLTLSNPRRNTAMFSPGFCMPVACLLAHYGYCYTTTTISDSPPSQKRFTDRENVRKSVFEMVMKLKRFCRVNIHNVPIPVENVGVFGHNFVFSFS